MATPVLYVYDTVPDRNPEEMIVILNKVVNRWDEEWYDQRNIDVVFVVADKPGYYWPEFGDLDEKQRIQLGEVALQVCRRLQTKDQILTRMKETSI